MNKNRKTRENIRIRKELKKKGQKYQIESICKSHKKIIKLLRQKASENHVKGLSKCVINITSKSIRNCIEYCIETRCEKLRRNASKCVGKRQNASKCVGKRRKSRNTSKSVEMSQNVRKIAS